MAFGHKRLLTTALPSGACESGHDFGRPTLRKGPIAGPRSFLCANHRGRPNGDEISYQPRGSNR